MRVVIKSITIGILCFLLYGFTSVFGEEIIIVFSQGVTNIETIQILKKYPITPITELKSSGEGLKYITVKSEGKDIKELIESLKAERHVKEVFLNFQINLQSESSPSELLQKLVDSNSLTELSRAVGYLQRFPGDTVTITYLDSGFLFRDHPFVEELINSGRLLEIDGEYGADVISGTDSSYYPEDVYGHGTAITSLGLSYSPHSRFFIIRVSEKGEFRFSKLLEALDIVEKITQQTSDRIVINMSFSAPVRSIIEAYQQKGYSDEEAREQCERLMEWFKINYINPLLDAGVIFVSASSNDGTDVEVFPGNIQGIISVGDSVNSGEDELSDILAPSALYIANKDFSSLKFDQGTSYATSLVSAFLAEVLRVNSNLTQEEIKYILQFNSFNEGLAGMLEFLQRGVSPLKPISAPEINFPVVAHLATVYSALKDIKEGLDTADETLLTAGIVKLETDLGDELPFSIEMGEDFSQVIENVEMLYTPSTSKADIPSYGVSEEGYTYTPTIFDTAVFDLFY